MTIENRNLTAGTKLVGKYHKQQHTCLVEAGENGKLKYKLEDGREFKSPSAAGMAITGHACDGWHFWTVATAEAAPNNPAQEPANAEANPNPAPAAENANAEKGPEANPATNASSIETTDAPVPENAQNPAKTSFKRTPNQKGAPEGQTRWYCQPCGESFLAPYGEIPLACPQGHKG